MKRSLSTRLMYSYMGLIAVIIVGVSVGLSYLITDYFFKDKERELNTKGAEVAIIANYFLTMDANSTSLERYLSSVDQLIGARIWLFDTKYELLATSEKPEDVFKMEPEGKANAGEENTKNPGKSGPARRDNAQKAVASIGEQI